MTVASGVRDVKVKGNTVRPRELNINTSLDTDFAAAGVPRAGAKDLITAASIQVEICCITADADDGDGSESDSADAEESAVRMIHSLSRARREHTEL